MFFLDFSDKRSISEQIVAKITEFTAAGLYPPGYQIPSVRSLATELSINPNTVQKAYSELERLGITVSVRGKGSIIAENSDAVIKLHKDRIAKSLSEAAADAVMINMDYEQLSGELRSRFTAEAERIKGKRL